MTLQITVFVLILATIATLVYLWWNLDHDIQPLLSHQTYTSQTPTAPHKFVHYREEFSFNRAASDLTNQHEGWSSQMLIYGKQMKAFGVDKVYFVHGTFVGNDPLGIIHILRAVYPRLKPEIENAIRQQIKKNNDFVVSDMGNYTDQYVELFSQVTKIAAKNFNWSSGNHHLARLRGSISLLFDLRDSARKEGTKYFLLCGHSHAGQVFALLSRLLYEKKSLEYLWPVIEKDGFSRQEIEKAISELSDKIFDFVTFGTPPRYGWAEGDYRLINVVNHRGNEPFGGGPDGLLQIRDGDYIQQWGIAGTDMIMAAAHEKTLNRELNKVLGVGYNPTIWLRNARCRMRVPEHGTTLLVDYIDNLVLPSAILSVFGHGVYTRLEVMKFNTGLIVDEFYTNGH